jgi:hypothetical protein
MNDMLDDRFEDQLRDAARGYNSPPETPRDLMWEQIVAARPERAEQAEGAAAVKAEKELGRVLMFRSFRHLRLPAAIAALLALGIGLGRLTAPRPESPAQPGVLAEVSPRAADLPYRIATAEHLGQSETFLTLFRASLRQNGNAHLASSTASQLLATNRLLLDSPAANDKRTRLLLQDLELVLAEIAQLSGRSRSPDLELITEGLEESGVMSRLRTAVPSGTNTTQGVL